MTNSNGNSGAGIALIFVTIGGVMVYSGLKGKGVTDILAGDIGGTLNPSGGKAMSESGGGDFPTDISVLGGMPAGGTTTFDGKPVASWIVPILQRARKSGKWKGQVTSGWRDPAQIVTPSPGLPVAPQGKSNHNTTYYPGGAVDVSDPDGLERALQDQPTNPTLIRGRAIGDLIHFSATGH